MALISFVKKVRVGKSNTPMSVPFAGRLGIIIFIINEDVLYVYVRVDP